MLTRECGVPCAHLLVHSGSACQHHAHGPACMGSMYSQQLQHQQASSFYVGCCGMHKCAPAMHAHVRHATNVTSGTVAACAARRILQGGDATPTKSPQDSLVAVGLRGQGCGSQLPCMRSMSESLRPQGLWFQSLSRGKLAASQARTWIQRNPGVGSGSLTQADLCQALGLVQIFKLLTS